MLLRGPLAMQSGESYIIKALKYFFLVDVTFLFTLKADEININQLIITCLVLLFYFMGKLQNRQKKIKMFQMVSNGVNQQSNHFNLKAEIALIIFAITFFIGFIFFPQFAKNPLSNWFHTSILDIENTPVFGFIFKVIGFFFLISIILKMINAFTFLIAGAPIVQTNISNEFHQEKEKKNDKFDDFEEVE